MLAKRKIPNYQPAILINIDIELIASQNLYCQLGDFTDIDLTKLHLKWGSFFL